ncbi:MAG: septal ring lytic transglycosylase RlpA family protein [Sediminibacterium sp.]|jgi:rare lipoprotein A|uniref:septal ring lytic transglycosylase RlpA family protein n=1 Tax=Sediminibacterium sp. TaxID=1917865 RepID=UPI0025F352BA|nr:septal ring lytic transglycosylase RlpA family protein [Sediminibacterium sp.]MDO8995278.1 septal ring lytic transglycosylase RlpA family protein [Sediminibacterium sp.]
MKKPVLFLLGFAFTVGFTSCFRKGSETGMASFYADKYVGRKTSNGEKFKQNKLTAAHKTLPFGTKVKVTNLNNGQSVKVRINDRGPFIQGRIIDLSKKAAKKIDMVNAGVTKVTIRY